MYIRRKRQVISGPMKIQLECIYEKLIFDESFLKCFQWSCSYLMIAEYFDDSSF